jgi:hypothetical protein
VLATAEKRDQDFSIVHLPMIEDGPETDIDPDYQSEAQRSPANPLAKKFSFQYQSMFQSGLSGLDPQASTGDSDMKYTLYALLLTLGLFLGMMLLLEVGRRIGIRRRAKDAEGASEGLGTLDGAVFALLGLLIAFTFSGAASRFDTRRHLIVEETNDIGTAYLRLDLLPAGPRSTLQESFRHYVDSRLEVYRKLPDMEAAKQELARSTKLQEQIWEQAVAACREANYQPATMLLLPALNAMIDITTTRTMATKMHPPAVIFVMLCGIALAASLLAGYGMAGAKLGSRVHKIVFAATLAISIYVIIDLEFPRLGFVRVDTFDQALVELRESMK